MPVLFISHSSKDDALADALEGWLRRNGFNDIFLDHKNIAGGEKWPEALRASARDCSAVVCLISENWLASLECYNEYGAAWYMGKRIIPLFLLPTTTTLDEESKSRLRKVCAEDQGIDLSPCLNANGVLDVAADEGVANRLNVGLRAAGAISRVGLDPEAFPVDVKLRETPFPGLASFGDDDVDAALFYGRSREIAHTLEELRKIRAERDLRPLVILGASGAGKSSLLKAGVIPRLRREAPAWLPLRAFRPGADPLLNFAEALSRTLNDFGRREAHGLIRDRLFNVWTSAERNQSDLSPTGLATISDALEAEGKKLRDASGRPGASILISVDQAEEITRANSHSGEALADYLRVALASTQSPWQLAFTIRTDSFPELQSHRRFQDLEARGYDLRAIPVFRFDSVVEEPAKRYGVVVDHNLVEALIEDAPKADALPLLAFALQRLWQQYAASGALTKDNYERVGGLTGLIEDAAERAMRGLAPEQDVPLPATPPPKHQTELAATTFVPALAEINDQGATIRHIAKWSSFNEEQQELLRHFDRWRLILRKGDSDGGTVEIAHEALFRTWKRLQGWLEPERARLEALRSLQVDASNWDRNGRNSEFLNHRETRLGEALALSEIGGYARRLAGRDLAYLNACHAAERSARAQARRGKALVGALMAMLAVVGAGWWNQTFVREQLHWYTTMRPSILTPDVETAIVTKPGSRFKDCAGDCPDMVVVPSGNFKMGERNLQREVAITKPFAVAKFEVTFAEWDACFASGACPRANDDGWGRKNRPVINISWEDAKQYVDWLARMTGKPYRLLTDAEWEYAARAGSTTTYFWGDDIGLRNANCADCGSRWDGEQTAEAGSFPPNAFGLHDMHGNVREWVADAWNEQYEAPRKSESANNRVVRDGSWSNDPRLIRSANRYRENELYRQNNLGFRVARSLHP